MENILKDRPITLKSIRNDLESYYYEHLENALSAINDPDIRTRIELLVEEWCDDFESATKDHLETILDFLELYCQKIDEASETTNHSNTANTVIEISRKER